MIEVRNLIPQVYNQSRDFSVFMGLIQDYINTLDVKSKVLESLPIEDILPYSLSSYKKARKYFREFLKNRGTVHSILYAVSLAGGKLITFEEEEESAKNSVEGYSDSRSFDRFISEVPEDIPFVYTLEKVGTGVKMLIYIKNLGELDQDFLKELFYYIKPVNLLVEFIPVS